MKDIPKKYLIGGAVAIVVLIIVIVAFAGSRKATTQQAVVKPTNEPDEVIPTVDSSVMVEAKGINGNKEVALNVSGFPVGTTGIDYELSYLTKAQGTQGSIGNIVVTGNDHEIKRQITLGTCSSGTCVYHEVIGGVKVTLKFSGDYGEKLFEKDFDL